MAGFGSKTQDKKFGSSDPRAAAYVRETYLIHDDVFAEIEERAAREGLRPIHICHFDARHLEVLARAIGARRIIEIGALAGLSGVSLARALPPDGILHTFEVEPKNAEVVAESFRRSGLTKKVRVHVGPALEKLKEVEEEGPFDMMFIDADKRGYPDYLQWGARHLRLGGTVLADNSFGFGSVYSEEEGASESERLDRAAFLQFNSMLGDPEGPWRSTMLPTGEGLAMGVRVK